jgi:leucyl aminopeptidase
MAKQTKQTTVIAGKETPAKYRGDVMVLAMFENTKRLPAEYVSVDKAASGAVSALLKLGDFCGKANETTVLYVTGTLKCKRIILVGLGDKKKLELDTLRQAAGTATRMADKLSAAKLGMILHLPVTGKLSPEQMAQAITEGAIVGRYDYQDYLPAKKDSLATMRITILDTKAAVVTKLARGVKIGTAIAQGQNYARMIGNKPGNEINPPSLARQAQQMARKSGLKCKIFNDTQLTKMKMNAILAVGSGSASKPRLIMLEHNSRKSPRPDLVVVGKAITFDSGGISIKPSQNMESMKFDKCGGCAALGIMAAVAKLKLPLRVVGLIPSAENLPSNTSYRPGDIIRTYSGKTVEVQNTDAEGRMILSDALAYAAKMKPKAIIDMATLTGACVVALGDHNAGLFGNNDTLLKKITQASKPTGEPVWQMPIGGPYLEQMKSKIADLKNIGGRGGGASTAASFLGEFVGDTPWAHIDIAAMADTDTAKPYCAIGATGFAVRLVTEYLRSL